MRSNYLRHIAHALVLLFFCERVVNPWNNLHSNTDFCFQHWFWEPFETLPILVCVCIIFVFNCTALAAIQLLRVSLGSHKSFQSLASPVLFSVLNVFLWRCVLKQINLMIIKAHLQVICPCSRYMKKKKPMLQSHTFLWLVCVQCSVNLRWESVAENRRRRKICTMSSEICRSSYLIRGQGKYHCVSVLHWQHVACCVDSWP